MANVILNATECEPGGLPMVCMACGQSAEVARPNTFACRLADAALIWMIGLFLCGPWAFINGPMAVFVAMVSFLFPFVFSTRRRVWTPLCPDHASYWVIRAWLTKGGMLAVFGSLIGTFIVTNPDSLFDSLVGYGLIVWLIVASAWIIAMAILSQTSIRAFFIGKEFELHGVHDNFATALDRQRSIKLGHLARRNAVGGS